MLDQAVVVADKTGTVRVWTPGAETLFGHDADAAVGQSLDILVPPEYREHHWRGFHAAMKGDNLNIDRASVNVPALHRDGAILRLAVRLLVLRDAQQNVVGAMAIFTKDDGPASALPRL
jgi:PAS domain S-box-containing protein